MNKNTANSMREMIYSNLQIKDTEELLEIWTQNDREAWTDEAFDIIRDLLLERIGELPEQNQPAQVGVQADLYHNPEILHRFASWSKIFSWVFVIISALFMIGNIFALAGQGSFLLLLVLILEAFGVIFGFSVLQAVGELIYLFMDIEDNTRRERLVR